MACIWTLLIGALVANCASSEANLASEKAKMTLDQDALAAMQNDSYEKEEQAHFDDEYDDDNVKRATQKSEANKIFCDHPDCICYYTADQCPEGYSECSESHFCTLNHNKPCCVGHGGACPCGWQLVGSICYLFDKTKMTHDQARKFCREKGGDLALPLNATENAHLYDRAKANDLIYPWISLFRRYDGKFVTGCGLIPSYTNWNRGEPNGGYRKRNGDFKESCGHFFGSKKWNDRPCDYLSEVICELKHPRCR